MILSLIHYSQQMKGIFYNSIWNWLINWQKLLKDAGKQQARATYKTKKLFYLWKKFTLKSNKFASNCQAFCTVVNAKISLFLLSFSLHSCPDEHSLVKVVIDFFSHSLNSQSIHMYGYQNTQHDTTRPGQKNYFCKGFFFIFFAQRIEVITYYVILVPL